MQTPNIPRDPDLGYIGGDATLLDLDRAFDTDRIVLLYGLAGSGKTATSAEFARRYTRTGGVAGPALFTSFEQPQPLARVLDVIGQVLADPLERQGIQWLSLTNSARGTATLRVLQEIRVLWVWDNVEPVAGYPDGVTEPLNAAEQQELVDFLRDIRQTQAKVLLTSRRDERSWLLNLPRRVQMRPLPLLEHGGQQGDKLFDN
jgi:hypothetical protein